MRLATILCLLSLMSAACASAKPLTYRLPEDKATFKPGPGVDAAQNNCAACHSIDYVNSQPPKRGKAFWDAEVQKMIKVYHAPITDADAATISAYLASTY
ncbi:MAG: sulfite:cytochrome oxidoreductase subunit [Hyphomicrobiales bacterium]|nr:sulfite:cytochrome oxidoreductase subunit [Hyphomicrobiales bacterium]